MSVGGLPPMDRSLLPADVRDAGPETRQAYQAALGFERMLVAQLAKQLTDTAGGDQETSAATSAYRDLLPDALADGVTAAGGLGLARQLFDSQQATSR